MNEPKVELPSFLKEYRNADFGLQARAIFFYRVAIVMAVLMIAVIIYTAIIQINSPEYGYIYIPVILPEILIFIFILLSLFILATGRFRFSTHMLVVSSFMAVWAILFFDKSNTLGRFDTVVYIFAVFSLLPLMIHRGRMAIQIYVGINILVLGIFVYTVGRQLNLQVHVMAEYFLDVFICLIFAGIISLKIFRINKDTQDRAIRDLNERHEAEKSLIASEKKYSETIDLLPQTIFEADLTGRLTYVNNSGFNTFGYSPDDFIHGLNVLEMITENERALAGENMKKLVESGDMAVNEYNALRKDGTVFPVEIYSSVIRTDTRATGFRGILVDVTERKKTEAELYESRQQYQTLAQMSPVGIFRTDAQGNTTYVNPRWTEISGLSLNEAVGDGWIKAVHPDDRKSLINRWNTDFSNINKSVAEYRFLKPDGKVIWVLGNAVPEIINGEIKGYVGTITNISELKDAQSAVEKSEKRFRDLADLLPQTVWESKMDGKLTYVNKHGLKLFGITENDINGDLDIFTCITSDNRERAQDYIRNVVEHRWKEPDGEEFTGLRKDGATFPIKVFLSIIYEDGIAEGIRSVVMDMSEVKKAEYELKESEARYRSIIEALPDMILVSDLKGNVIYCNDPFQRITGVGAEDYNKPDRIAQIHPDDYEFVASAIKDLLTSDKKFTGTIENRFIDNWGKVHWFSGISSKITYGGQLMLQTITRDITEKKANDIELEKYRNHLEILVRDRTEELETINQKLLEEQRKLESALETLKQAQAQLVQSEKMASLGILAAGVAHEINNPLNFIQGGIIGLDNYFMEHLEDHVSYVKPLINGINEGVRRAANIVSSLGHYSRQDDVPMVECDIHSVIDNCLVMLQNQIKGRIEINKNYAVESLNMVCNEGKVHQAILNLLANAVQSIEKEGNIIITTAKRVNGIEIKIADTGQGIPEENIPKIFDPFFTTKEPGKGTGLGLSITYNIIKEHGGSVNCRSKPGEGSEFIIILPYQLNNDA